MYRAIFPAKHIFPSVLIHILKPFQILFDMALEYQSGTDGDVLKKKNHRKKSHDAVPIKPQYEHEHEHGHGHGRARTRTETQTLTLTLMLTSRLTLTLTQTLTGTLKRSEIRVSQIRFFQIFAMKQIEAN
jgi:hypothetical protein